MVESQTRRQDLEGEGEEKGKRDLNLRVPIPKKQRKPLSRP